MLGALVAEKVSIREEYSPPDQPPYTPHMPSFSSVAVDAQAHDQTLLSALHNLAQQTPSNDFLVEDVGVSLTYRQSYILASRLFPPQIRRLCPSLLSPRHRKVVLISANNALFPLTLWALWFMSFTVVPISVKSEQSLWGAMVDLVDPDVLLISRSLEDVAAQHLHLANNLHIAYLEDLIPVMFTLQSSSMRQSDFIPSLLKWLSNTMETEQGPDSGLGDLPYVDLNLPVISLFTSSAVDASTLKSVTYTHAILIHSASKMVEMLGGPSYSSRPIRHLGWLPLSHCFEFCISLLGIVLQTGGSYIFFDRQVSSPQSPSSTPLHVLLLQAIQYHQPVDSLCIVPAIFADMVRDIDLVGMSNLKAMRSLGVGGAPTSEDTFQWAAEQGIPYFDCSGATEVAGTLCIRRAMVRAMRSHGLQVAPGLEGFLEKDSLEDNFGELVVRGAFLPVGYDNKESSAFMHDSSAGMTIYRAGDLYEQDAEMKGVQSSLSYLKGENIPGLELNKPPLSGLKYLGRIDDLVVLASGVKIDALAIERRLDDHRLVLRSAVISDIAREAPVVLLQPSAETNEPFDACKAEEIVRFVLELNRALSFDKRIRPENIVFVDELPTTTKLTLNRKKVKKTWAESRGRWPGTKVRMHTSDLHAHEIHSQLLLRAETRGRIESLLSDIFDIPVEHFARQSVHFSEIPLTSLSSVQLARALESHFSIKLSASQLYSLRSVDDICDLVVGSGQTMLNGLTRPEDRDSSLSDTIRVPNSVQFVDSSLVITGVACRYPGNLHSLDDLWGALLDPQTYAKKVPRAASPSRWRSETVQNEDIPPIAWLEVGSSNDLEAFRDFFRLSPADAESMSPNARLVLQLGYQAIEDAGIPPSSLSGQSWGVFSSVNNSGWRERRLEELDLHEYSVSLLGSADDAVGARLSYFLNLTGPAVEIKTACSSSAVAIHQACSSIRNGDCDAAIVISSTTHFHPSGPIFRSSAGIASKSGRCATFSEEADGFLPGEGCAAIVIQKAADAQCSAYARIKASHIAQDGRSHGFFAPNPTAQTRLLNQALKKAGCTEDDIDFIEAHGTGTQLGDAVEMQAMDKVFRGKRTKPLIIGSVKAVLGHTEESAGLSSVLKSLLCLRNNAIPAQPNFRRPNPQIDFGGSKFSIPRHITSFPRCDRPRRIGISSFGLSGTLAHIILEDVERAHISPPTCTPGLFLLSANDHRSYNSLVRRYLDFAMSPSALEAEFKAICKTTQIGRDHLSLRRAWPIHDHYSWTTAMLNELREPKPRHRLRSGSIRLGIWFGLPLPKTSFDMLDCPLFDHERALVADGNWDRQYSVFAQELTIANVLKALGCQIGAVGGEGMAEWVAAAFSGILHVNSVFQKKANPEGVETYLLQGSKEKIAELLTQWLPSELALRGCYTDELCVLEGRADAAKEFSELGDFTLSLNSSLIRAAPPHDISPYRAAPFISGHLGEVLDEDTLANQAYWARASSNVFDSLQGIECLAAQCDLVLHIGGPSLAFGPEKYVHFGSESFEHLLGLLYERGCDIDWASFGTNGQMMHLPVYQWSPES